MYSLKTKAQRHLVKLSLVQQVKDDLFAHFDNICVVPMVLRWAVAATDSIDFVQTISEYAITFLRKDVWPPLDSR